MNVARSSKILAPVPQITRHRKSEVCDLGKLKIYTNLKCWLQEVWTRGCVMSFHLFVWMFCVSVPCSMSAMEKQKFLHRMHARTTPSPSFLGTICSYKIRGYHSGVADESIVMPSSSEPISPTTAWNWRWKHHSSLKRMGTCLPVDTI
jgi:hypothetical protein